MKKKWFAAALLAIGLLAAAPYARASDIGIFTSCHVDGGCGNETSFGTVTLTQDGTSVDFDVVLSDSDRFVETGAGGKELFLFDDTLIGSAITNISATLNGTVVAIPGGLSGFTNLPPVMADGTGDFTASVECTLASSCNGGSTPDINDLHFTVTNATLAQLEVPNANGNIDVADILVGSNGRTGDVDIESFAHVPEPSTLLLLGSGLCAAGIWRRRKSMHGSR